MNTNAVCTAVAAKAAGIAGMRGTSALLPDTIPSSPWLIVGSHAAAYDAGPMDHIHYTFPLRCYVERAPDSARTQATVNDLVDAFVTAYRNGLTLGGTVTEARITAWNTDLYAEVGSALYQVVEFTLLVVVTDTTGHTP
jgi:hypothetical protein